MNSDYAARYRHLYMNHWWWRAREEAILRVLQHLPRGRWRQQILDIGCGDGLLFDKLREFGDVEGVEVCADLVSPGSPWRDQIHVGPFDESFQPEGQYDRILMLDVLEHFENPLAALRHARTLLAPNGILVIHVPALRMLWTSHDDVNHHYTRYTRRTLRQVVHQASLNVESMRYLFHWTCPVKLAIRAKESLLAATSRLPSVPRPWLNRFCLRLCQLEQRIFRRHSPGFGSSILAVVTHGTLGAAIDPDPSPAAVDDEADVCHV